MSKQDSDTVVTSLKPMKLHRHKMRERSESALFVQPTIDALTIENVWYKHIIDWTRGREMGKEVERENTDETDRQKSLKTARQQL